MASQTLKVMVIAFQGGRAVLPKSVVEEVLPYARSLRMENAPPWVAGSILWKTEPIPLVSLERLVYRTSPGPGAHTRIIVINALSEQARARDFAILSTEPPQLADLERDGISAANTDEPLDQGVLQRVWIYGKDAIIPDVLAIEAALSRIGRN